MSTIAALAFEIAAKDAAWPVMPIVMADADTGEIVYVTPAAAETFQYETKELLGKQVEILVPPDSRPYYSTVRPVAVETATRLMGGSKYRLVASGEQGPSRTVQGMRKDGTIFPAVITLTSARVLERNVGIAFVVDVSIAVGGN